MLTAKEEAALRQRAKDLGIDPDEFVEAARKADAEGGDGEPDAENGDGEQAQPAKGAQPGASAEPPKIFQYSLPFIRVNEYRTSLGLKGDAPDGELFCGEWLLKHGGALAGAPAAKPETPTTTQE